MNPIKHVAIIMDGNGRWGLKRNNSRNFGHKAGLITAEKIIKKTIEKNIKFLTLFQQKTGRDQKKKSIFYLICLMNI